MAGEFRGRGCNPSGMVVLRPFRADEHAAARARAAPRGRRAAARLRRSGTFAYGVLDLAIEADGALVGWISARSPRNFVPPGLFELGIEIWPEARGRGIGREAVAQLADILFTEHAAGRFQATTAHANEPMQRVLRALGFAEEGRLREFMPQGGTREDYLLFALTRSDWERAGGG
jgi:RimJ/RimL family protein N-acetyltransferase